MSAVGALLLAALGGSHAVAQETAASPPAAAAPSAEEKRRPLKLPSGFRKKLVAGVVLYCSQSTPIGTRLRRERCYDETGIRELIALREAQQADLHRAQTTCATAGACGSIE
ncbi:MAG: hypothetical protein NZM12_02845 [Steroidobacteraceae bacterium]|nr:hypothetical protein [Steroidobacteraceae bacterium]MDW8260811.1 hypothetical protein [Gammaproteobacteria bacterium]